MVLLGNMKTTLFSSTHQLTSIKISELTMITSGNIYIPRY